MEELTLSALLRRTAARRPDHEALVYPEREIRLTYAELLNRSEQVARGFMALGVKQGDHVSVWTTNIPEWISLQFGLAMIGAVLVTVNTNYKSHELEYILRQSESTVLVLIPNWRDSDFLATAREILPELQGSDDLICDNLPHLRRVILIGGDDEMLTFEDLLTCAGTVHPEELQARESSLSIHAPINMQYTSGTTGFPKGVMLTHHNIVNNAIMVGDVMGLTPEDRLYIQVPLFHCFGCVMSTLNCVAHGSTMVLVEAYNPLKALRYVEQERCTAINGVPTMFIGILSHPEFSDHDLSSLRTGIMAGAPCPEELMNHVRTRMHCPEIVIAFGQTECSPVMTMTRRDDPVSLRVSTVGRLLPDIEGRIVDPVSGEDMPPDTQGEIVTRSSCIMKGYYKMPEATAAAIDADGWLHTGDLGMVDQNGYFKVTGRIKEMIIRGGENIYPREIEEFLHHHPKVSDVYVVGMPDPKYGEQLLAVVKLANGEHTSAEELQEFCHGRIARHKVPCYWEFVDDFPTTASGKVQKYKLVERFARTYTV